MKRRYNSDFFFFFYFTLTLTLLLSVANNGGECESDAAPADWGTPARAAVHNVLRADTATRACARAHRQQGLQLLFSSPRRLEDPCLMYFDV